jgi:hypothetical protein
MATTVTGADLRPTAGVAGGRPPLRLAPGSLGFVLLAEELALIALNPATGRFKLGMGSELNACLAGLLVAEALLDGSLELGDRQDRVVVAVGQAPTSPLTAAAVEVAAEKGPKLRAVLSHMSRGLQRRFGRSTREAVLDGLRRQGIVTASSGGARPAWPVLDQGARDAVVARLQQAARGDGPIEPRTALVLSMTGPAKLLELVAPDRDTRRHARRRIDHALDGSTFAGVGKAVRKLIEEAAAAAA